MSGHYVDPFGRKIEYLRLSVNEKCNFRCFYCLPKGHKIDNAPNEWLTFEEIERVIRAFAYLGVSRIRVTGGEPLLRKNLDKLVTKIANIPGIEDLSLSTNAALLDRYAYTLKQAGIARINVSLDSLIPERFEQITGAPLKPVIDSLMVAKKIGLAPIKINMVAMKGINGDECEDMVRFCMRHNFTLRFIETMPIGDTGRDAANYYLNLQEVKKQLSKTFKLLPSLMPGGGPARYFKIEGTEFQIGFITPISQHFCDTCNRVRLSASGTLYLCLGQEHKFELRHLLRAGISDRELGQALKKALTLKPERHNFVDQPFKVSRFMASIGG